ncbi:MAG TPA: ImmA/IrrE family metallo-endopeptidase [Gemmata sp.]|nr:ImmA/IrrE family metallo-endopeptidase [Gemmata sp.]
MIAPVWCIELATSFWAKVGSPPPFPRDLRHAATAVSLSVVEMTDVSVANVRRWFEQIAICVPLDEPDRPLRACLVAWRGEGFAFLNSRDDPAERAFSLAHELGHFLRDHLRPHETVAARLGKTALQVLDGQRPATPAERLHAVLRNVPLGPFTHLLRRDDSGCPLTPIERDAEAAADRLAFELLAPAEAVGDADDRKELTERLIRTFGLPPEPAVSYATILMPESPPIDRAISRLIVH